MPWSWQWIPAEAVLLVITATYSSSAQGRVQHLQLLHTGLEGSLAGLRNLISTYAGGATAQTCPHGCHASSPVGVTGGRVIASPYAKKLAREAGVDISQAMATGPDGRIVAADVQKLVSEGGGKQQPQQQAGASAQTQPKTQVCHSTILLQTVCMLCLYLSWE